MPRQPRGTKQRMIRLTDAEWDALLAIAAEHNLTYGGQPSAAEAVRWLIRRDHVVPIPSPAKSPGSYTLST
jgi:hypothetical protein